MQNWFLRLLFAAAALGLALYARPALATDSVVTDCSSESDLRAKLAAMQSSGGGTLTFACGNEPPPIVLIGGELPFITTATTIDGGGVVTLSGGNASRILRVQSAGNLTIKGIKLVKGRVNGGLGGAVFSAGTLHVIDSSFVENRANAGGAIVAQGPTTVTGGEFWSNTATNGGAVALVLGASATITNSRFDYNQAVGSKYDEGLGGAIVLFNPGTVATIETTRFSYNSAGYRGGVAYVDTGAALTLRFDTLESNSAKASGSAVHNEGATIVSRSLLWGNSGGTTILYNYGGTLALVNSTMAQNIGTALESTDGQADVSFSTIVDTTGHGVFNSCEDCKMTLQNTILAGSSERNCKVGVYDTIVSKGFNISDDATCLLLAAGDKGETDPMLSELGAWGGPTQSYRPELGSPAIDGGLCIAGIPIDQRDFSRPYGSACDIGAVELRRHQLTINRTGSGAVFFNDELSDCGEVCTRSLWEHWPYLLVPVPEQGRTFAGWGGPCSGTGECVVRLGAPATVTASFVPIQQKVYLPAVQK